MDDRDTPLVNRFTSGDQAYLREVQYADPARLTARADLHAKYRTADEAWFPWLASQVRWPRSGEVLEVGCGPGWLWEEAADRLPDGLRLTLTDLSAGMVCAAAARVGGLGRFSAVVAEVADVQRLPFPASSFDVVIANHMLYHVADLERAVAELARVLRPAGSLLAAANGPANLRELWQIRSELFDLGPTYRTADRFGSVTGLPILRSSFGRVEWRPYADELRCTEPGDVVAYLTSFPPFEDPSPDLIADLESVVHARFDAGEGVLTITKDAGAFVAHQPRPSTRATRPGEAVAGGTPEG